MRRQNGIRWLLTILMGLMLCASVTSALAAENGTLTVSLKGEEGWPLSGVKIAIYQIGEMRDDYSWWINSAFSEVDILGATTTKEIDAAAGKVAQILHASTATGAIEGSTDAKGQLTFRNLNPGIYYGEMTEGAEGLEIQSFLISVPYFEGNAYRYNVGVAPKMSYTEPVTPTPVPTPTPTNSPTPTPQRTPTPTPEPTFTPAPSPSESPSESPSTSPSVSPSVTTDTPVPSPSESPSVTTDTPEPEEEETPTPTVTPTPTPTVTPTPSPIPPLDELLIEILPVPTPTLRPTPTPVPTNPHNLTVYYIYEDGTPAATTHYEPGLWPGTDYDVPSPVIPGYTATILRVTGTMPNHDMVYTVIYIPRNSGRRLINLDDYETPLGLGEIQIHVGVCYE